MYKQCARKPDTHLSTDQPVQGQGLPFCVHLLHHKFYDIMTLYKAAHQLLWPGFDLTP